MPIFDAGVRKANINQARAQYTAAKSVYESVARNAVREVEEALTTLNSAASRLDDVKKSAAGFKASFDATDTRFKANLANLFELEEARRAYLQAQNNSLALDNERVLAWISLYRAMGGGWVSADASANIGSQNLAETEPKLVMDKLLQSLEAEPMQAEPAETQAH